MPLCNIKQDARYMPTWDIMLMAFLSVLKLVLKVFFSKSDEKKFHTVRLKHVSALCCRTSRM